MNLIRNALLVLSIAATALAFASSGVKSVQPDSTERSMSTTEVNQDWMLEGEKRYRENCGRCHQPPHKFSPRTMAMVVRHMRVRAMLTDDDMKYVLYYMSH